MQTKTYLLLLTVFTLGGCGNLLKTSVVSTSPRTVVIQSFGDFGEVQKMASSECRKYGHEARYTPTTPDTVEYVFDCVQ